MHLYLLLDDSDFTVQNHFMYEMMIQHRSRWRSQDLTACSPGRSHHPADQDRSPRTHTRDSRWACKKGYKANIFMSEANGLVGNIFKNDSARAFASA